MLAMHSAIQVVDATATCAQALEAIRIHLPDVILLDLRMPDMDGIAFLELPLTVRSSARGDCVDQLRAR